LRLPSKSLREVTKPGQWAGSLAVERRGWEPKNPKIGGEGGGVAGKKRKRPGRTTRSAESKHHKKNGRSVQRIGKVQRVTPQSVAGLVRQGPRVQKQKNEKT